MYLILFYVAKIRLYIARKKAVKSKQKMDSVICKTCAAKEEIDKTYKDFLENVKRQEECTVNLRRLRKIHSDRPILRVSVNADKYTMSDKAEKTLTKLDVETALVRHRHGDWGVVKSDCWKHNNDSAVKKSGKVISLYPGFGNNYFYVETDLTRGKTRVRLDGEAA